MATDGDTFARIPDRIKGLGDMACNLWWSWHPEAKMLFKMLGRRAWKERLHNPVRLLNEIPERTLQGATFRQLKSSLPRQRFFDVNGALVSWPVCHLSFSPLVNIPQLAILPGFGPCHEAGHSYFIGHVGEPRPK